MNAGRLHTDAAANASNTPTSVNKLAWQQDEDQKASILAELWGDPDAPLDPIDLSAITWGESLPPLYRNPTCRQAAQETRHTGDWPSWDDLKAAAQIRTHVPEATIPCECPPLACDGKPSARWPEIREEIRQIEEEIDQHARTAWEREWQRVGHLRPLAAAFARCAGALRDAIGDAIHPAALHLLGAGDAAIREAAHEIAAHELEATNLRGKLDLLTIDVDGNEMTTQAADAQGVEWTYSPTIIRLVDPKYWTTKLRAQITEACLLISARLGIVGHGRSLYVDDHILGRHQDRQAANAAMAAATVMRSGVDEVMLADLIKTGQDAALARVYAQCLGMQHLGEDMGLVPVFLTLTLPGEWHANPKHRAKGHAWNGESARAARAQLIKDWQTYTRRLRGKVIVLGLRVIEPHQDGTPHLHAMVWIAPDDLPNAYGTLRRTFGSAPRAKAVRISAKRKNAAKPSSYLLKYILKTMAATEEPEAKASREAHKAWASAVRARRWELIGCASGIQRTWQTVYNWRKLPRDARASEAMRTAWEAMRAADAARAAQEDSAPHWAAAMRALIGEEALAGGGRAARAVRNTYAEAENKYGETVKRPDGITDGRVTIRKERQWTMVRLTADEIAQREQARCPASPVSKSPDVGLAASYPREAVAPPPTAPPEAAGPPPGRYDPRTEVIRLIKERQHLPQWQKWIQDRRQHWGLAEAA